MYQLSGLTTSFLKGRRRLANKEAKSSTTTIKCVSVSKNGRVTLGPFKKTSELVLAPLLQQKTSISMCSFFDYPYRIVLTGNFQLIVFFIFGMK